MGPENFTITELKRSVLATASDIARQKDAIAIKLATNPYDQKLLTANNGFEEILSNVNVMVSLIEQIEELGRHKMTNEDKQLAYSYLKRVNEIQRYTISLVQQIKQL